MIFALPKGYSRSYLISSTFQTVHDMLVPMIPCYFELRLAIVLTTGWRERTQVGGKSISQLEGARQNFNKA